MPANRTPSESDLDGCDECDECGRLIFDKQNDSGVCDRCEELGFVDPNGEVDG